MTNKISISTRKKHDYKHSTTVINKNNRIIWLDIVRCIAILLVVLCHATEAIYSFTIEEWNNLTLSSNIFKIISFTLGRLSVPLFLFLSGYLLLRKNINNSEDCKKFYKNNLVSLLITVEIWNIVYNILIPIINNSNFNIKELILNMLFLKNVNLPNMWYMPMILGTYIAIPFLAILVKKVDFKTLMVPMIIIFCALFLLPNISTITNILFSVQFDLIIDLSFLGGIYGLYILLGYYVEENKFKNIKTRYLILIGILFFIISCGYQIWMFKKGYAYNIWYNFSGLLITGLCIFEMFSRINFNFNKQLENIFTYISKASLGIFFIHIIVQKILLKYINFYIINTPITVVLLTLTIFIISLILILFISKIKVIKKRFLLIK